MKRDGDSIMMWKRQSPCGELILGSYREKLCMCDWGVSNKHLSVCHRLQRGLNARIEHGTSEMIETASRQLDEYFEGKRRAFDVPLIITGTDFQVKVCEELLRIPFGTTISYAELAQLIDNPKAVRAVANAVATNAISILVPCHRIIGSDNKLTGFAGGLEAKRFLLNLEAQGR